MAAVITPIPVSNAGRTAEDVLQQDTWPDVGLGAGVPGHQDYLGLLCANNNVTLDALAIRASVEVAPENRVNHRDAYRTCDPNFWREFKTAERKLNEYFEDSQNVRPLNCLLLGPAGSGKTFLARLLGEMSKNTGPMALLEYNLSVFDSPARIGEMLREIGRNAQRTKSAQIVFLDEFDVTIGGSSMVRWLIDAIYEGKFGDQQTLGKTVFFFSGSYLKNKGILWQLQRSASDFDFIHFLFDTYIHQANQPSAQAQTRHLLDLSIKYRDIKNQISPDRDALDYLRRLDKMVDFVSRINGFIIEVVDISAPLEITENPLQVGLDEIGIGTNHPAAVRYALSAYNVESFVSAKEAYAMRWLNGVYPEGYHLAGSRNILRDPVLEYKNMLLCERLTRVVYQIRKQAIRLNASGKVIKISCGLLNYLCTVPLVHGMRSLDFLVQRLTLVGSNTLRFLQDDNPEILRLHVRQSGFYRDEATLWTALTQVNEIAARGKRAGYLLDIALPSKRN